MQVSNKKIRDWKVFSEVVSNYSDYYADEIFSTVLNNLDKKLKESKDFEITDNYVFISLKNAYLNLIKKENVQKQKKVSLIGTTYFDEVNYIATDLTVIEEQDKEFQNKLDCIQATYDKVLNTFEQQLFYIHFTNGTSQRQIAKDTGINVMVINKKINKIKTKIKEYYASNN